MNKISKCRYTHELENFLSIKRIQDQARYRLNNPELSMEDEYHTWSYLQEAPTFTYPPARLNKVTRGVLKGLYS